MTPTLTLVPDDLDDDTHDRLDKAIVSSSRLKAFEPSHLFAIAGLLVTIVQRSEKTLNLRYENLDNAADLLEQNPDLMEMLKVAWATKSFKEIRRLEILRAEGDQQLYMPTRSTQPTRNQEDAVEMSWQREYIGNGADALWDHLCRHFGLEKAYAHLIPIVQSSGMGKSRTLDELSKKHFTIPMNLRERTSTGYPPADHELRDFLTADSSRAKVYNRTCAFLEALFEHTAETIENEFDNVEPEDFASEFRRKMTDGQTYRSVNDFRKNFYDKVIAKAKALEEKQVSQIKDQPPVYMSPSKKSKYVFSAAQECERLIGALRKGREGSPSPGGEVDDDGGPVVIISFDEAHTMTITKTTESTPPISWSNYDELRHALRALNKFPIFSIFCSTTGKINLFSGPSDSDKSKRVVLGLLNLIAPFTDLGFDTFANKVSIDGDWNLEMVTSNSHIVRMGRPMFAAMYDAGDRAVQQDIILLAKLKLLNSEPVDIERLSNDQKLACLSLRIPIEFISTTYIDRENEQRQVEGHMRICLKVDANLESMITTSSSEPILSEAAYNVMSHPSFNVPKVMKSVLEGFSINKGDRGEFLVMLMFIITRDKAVGPPDAHGSPKSRILHVAEFLTRNFFRNHSSLKNILTDFADSRMHFNHYIKLLQHAAIDAESLLLLSTRGAAILCANNQHAIDGINPFLFKGTSFRRDNLGLILWQSKNDASFTATPRPELFIAMDPYFLNILKTDDAPIPLIKIVFALAARKPSLTVVRQPASDQYNAVVYEIWCAGISPDIFGAIEYTQATSWEALLQASHGWTSIYQAASPATQDLRRSENPGAALDRGHWDAWSIRRS